MKICENSNARLKFLSWNKLKSNRFQKRIWCRLTCFNHLHREFEHSLNKKSIFHFLSFIIFILETFANHRFCQQHDHFLLHFSSCIRCRFINFSWAFENTRFAFTIAKRFEHRHASHRSWKRKHAKFELIHNFWW